MSEFGDRTPVQELLDWTKYVKEEFGLTDDAIIVVLQKVLSHWIDPYESKFYEIQKAHK